MGSLTSRPELPSVPQQQIVYVPAPVPQPQPTYTSPPTLSSSSSSEESGTGGSGVADYGPDIDTEQSTARIQNLLRRNRGIGGTIKTGFRGLLSSNDLVPQRKTLLGE